MDKKGAWEYKIEIKSASRVAKNKWTISQINTSKICNSEGS